MSERERDASEIGGSGSSGGAAADAARWGVSPVSVTADAVLVELRGGRPLSVEALAGRLPDVDVEGVREAVAELVRDGCVDEIHLPTLPPQTRYVIP